MALGGCKGQSEERRELIDLLETGIWTRRDKKYINILLSVLTPILECTGVSSVARNINVSV